MTYREHLLSRRLVERVCMPKVHSRLPFLLTVLLLPGAVACAAREHHRAVTPIEMNYVRAPEGPTARVTIGQFVNRSTYMNGIFADGADRLGSQAQQILVTHLSQSPSFLVLDRRNMQALAEEAGYTGTQRKTTGADAVITGAVTEFGRKETGTRSLGGLIHKTKTQTLYAKVSLSVVDVRTSEVRRTYQGAGEYALTNKEVLGVGGYAGYDSTLADKVLNLAIMEAVGSMVEGRGRREW